VARVRQALIEGWQVADDRADLLAQLSGGRLGWAVQAAADPSVLEARAKALDDLIELVKSDRIQRFAYADALTRNTERAREALEVWRTWWRDVMLISAGSQAAPINLDRAGQLQALARQLDAAQAKAAAEACSRALWQLDRNATPRLVAEVLLLDLPVLRNL